MLLNNPIIRALNDKGAEMSDIQKVESVLRKYGLIEYPKSFTVSQQLAYEITNFCKDNDILISCMERDILGVSMGYLSRIRDGKKQMTVDIYDKYIDYARGVIK